MVGLIIVALVIIGAIVLTALYAPRIKRWINEKRNKEDGNTPLFNCTLVGKGKESDASGSGDIYDCVEDKGKT